MVETIHIAEMAEKLSDDLFAEFFWEKVGPTNQNWPCEDRVRHEAKTHPSDVVFFYDEPYSQVRTYINCDLKSYAKNSINSNTISSAVESLAKQVACAEKSEEWRRLYIHDHVSPEICGLLFVYNHDGEYDKYFSKNLTSIKLDKLDLPKKSKLIVLGPEDIFWLDNVRYELRQMRGASGPDRLPDREHCQYFYPQLVRKANVQVGKAKAATLEMLTAPWIILEYKNVRFGNRRGVLVFYRRNGGSTQEFMYLIDYLRHYQILDDNTDVQIKTLDTLPTAHAIFQKAVHQYIDEMLDGNGESDLAILVKAIKYSKMTQVVTTFSSIELGMGYE
jgi:hypothetical protein